MAAEPRPRRRRSRSPKKKNALLADALSDAGSVAGSDTSNASSASKVACPAIYDECKDKGLCYRFQRGLCTKGDKCAYKHETCTTPMPPGFRKEGKCKGKGKKGRSRSPPKPDTRSPEEEAKVPCRHHAKGKCTKGDQCPHKH